MENYEKLARRGLHESMGETQDQRLNNLALGLCSETGEVAGAVLKYQRRYKPGNITIRDVLIEVGDTLWFLANICAELQSDFDEAQRLNISKLSKRYPEKYSIDSTVREPIDAQGAPRTTSYPTPRELCEILWAQD
jgi:NTP pyrophosphatase (non-canonical NTP hydrolase)